MSDAPEPTRSDHSPATAQWLAARRRQVIEYLARSGVAHGAVADESDWFIHPYLSIWAVESLRTPGFVGWWVVCGDCPTDYVTATADQSPRAALVALAEQWRAAIPYLERGEQHPEFTLGDPAMARQLAPLLQERAEALSRLAADENLWREPEVAEN